MLPSTLLGYLKISERHQSKDKIALMKMSPCKHTYFGTLVEDVRSLPQYKALMAQTEIDGT